MVSEFFSTGGHNSVVYSDVSNYAKKLKNGDIRGIASLYYEEDIALCFLLFSYHKNKKDKKISQGQINSIYTRAKNNGQKFNSFNASEIQKFIDESKRDSNMMVFEN